MAQSASWLDAERLDHELVRRGLSLTRFGQRARIPLETLSRLRHRHQPLTSDMQKRIARALAEIPVAEGADLVKAR